MEKNRLTVRLKMLTDGRSVSAQGLSIEIPWSALTVNLSHQNLCVCVCVCVCVCSFLRNKQILESKEAVNVL